MSRLFLIRHGETEGNAAPDRPAPAHPALATRPRRRRSAWRSRSPREGIARIVSSDYARAATTAEHLQRATGAPLVIEPLLRERNFGDLRGRPYAELGFDMFEPDYAPPNGETLADVPRSRRSARGLACRSWRRRLGGQPGRGDARPRVPVARGART